MDNITVQQLRERIALLEAGSGAVGVGLRDRPVGEGDWVGAVGAAAPTPPAAPVAPVAPAGPAPLAAPVGWGGAGVGVGVGVLGGVRRALDGGDGRPGDPGGGADESPGLGGGSLTHGEGPGVRAGEGSSGGSLVGVVAAAVESLAGVAGELLPLVGEGELFAVVEQLGRLGVVRERVLLGVLTELSGRGCGHPGGLSPVDALRAVEPGVTAPAAKAVTVTAAAFGLPRWADLRDRVHAGQVSVAAAGKIIGFHERTHLVADPGELEQAVADLTGRAAAGTLEQLGRWVRHYTETLLPPRDLDSVEAARRAARGLWIDPPCTSGMVTGRFQLDPEGAATLRAAIDPLAAPRPTRGPGGETVRDPRAPATRRADALLAVIGRGVASPGAAPSTDKAKIVVTVDHDVLTGRVRGTGVTLTGEVLTPGTVRRLACDAQIIPAVLGTKSAPLDLGRVRRLFPPSLRSALWLRDGGCTYPDCTAPPTWCDAHHVTHWAHGGPTSIGNAALLCPRHHDHVHAHDLGATITPDHVTWHL